MCEDRWAGLSSQLLRALERSGAWGDGPQSFQPPKKDFPRGSVPTGPVSLHGVKFISVSGPKKTNENSSECLLCRRLCREL